MMSGLGIVTSFYEALGRSDLPTAVALLNDPLTWTEAVGSPYYGGTWRTPHVPRPRRRSNHPGEAEIATARRRSSRTSMLPHSKAAA